MDWSTISSVQIFDDMLNATIHPGKAKKRIIQKKHKQRKRGKTLQRRRRRRRRRRRALKQEQETDSISRLSCHQDSSMKYTSSADISDERDKKKISHISELHNRVSRLSGHAATDQSLQVMIADWVRIPGNHAEGKGSIKPIVSHKRE